MVSESRDRLGASQNLPVGLGLIGNRLGTRGPDGTRVRVGVRG